MTPNGSPISAIEIAPSNPRVIFVGTSKGGIAFAVTKAIGVPISYIGTGETVDDLTDFNAETFVDGLFFEEHEGEIPE